MNEPWDKLFVAEHSKKGRGLRHPENPIIYFPDGAEAHLDGSGRISISREPPDHPYECAVNVETYHWLVLQRCIDAFTNYRDDLTNEAMVSANDSRASLPNEEECLEKLRTLRGYVLNAQRQYDKARVRAESLVPPALRGRDERMSASIAKANKFLNKVSQVQI